MPVFRGVNNVTRKVVKQHRGVSNVTRNIKNEWRGVDNVARQVFQDGLTLYDYGKTDYALSTRVAYRGGSTKGTISSDCCYINSSGMLGDYYGNSDIDSTLGCPQFQIVGIPELTQENAPKYTKLQVTYEIGTAFSSAVNATEITFGGWAGHDWDYDTDLEYKGDSHYWECVATHPKGETGVFTKTFDLTEKPKFWTSGNYLWFFETTYYRYEKYATKAKNFYFGAKNYTKSGDDYREVYCRVPVYFYQIKLL